MGQLEGKKAVVLGAGSEGNIGQAIARRFAAEGAEVTVAGRKREPLEALAKDISGHAAVCDITARAEVEALVKTATGAMGRVDAAVNCTGWGLLKPLLDTTEEELDAITALQFKGVHHFLQAFVRQMVEQEPSGGALISLSSATTKALIGNHAAYIGTKTGSEALIRCVANDYGEHGIKANSISPAFTESPMTKDSFAVPGLTDAFLPRYPLARLNTAEDVADAAVWLASDGCFVTGENLQPNGGLTLRGNPQPADIERAVGAAAGE